MLRAVPTNRRLIMIQIFRKFGATLGWESIGSCAFSWKCWFSKFKVLLKGINLIWFWSGYVIFTTVHWAVILCALCQWYGSTLWNMVWDSILKLPLLMPLDLIFRLMFGESYSQSLSFVITSTSSNFLI